MRTVLESQSVDLGLYGKKKKPTSLLHCFRFIYCKYLLTSYVKLGQELTLRVEK